VHRFDIRLVLGAGVLLWSAATALTGLAHTFTAFLMLRLLLGIGESVTFPSTQLLLVRHTHEHQRGFMNGVVSVGQGVGPMLGTLFGGLAMAHFGWRFMFVALGVITAVWVVPWLLATRRAAIPAHVEEAGPSVSYLEILRQRPFWGTALGHFASNYGFYFLISWLPTFLVKSAGFSVTEMAGIGALVYGIYAATTALAGPATDLFIRRGISVTRVRKAFILTSHAGVAVTIALAGYVEPRNAVALLCIAGMFFGLGTPMIFAIGTSIAGPRAAGRWAGAQNVCGQMAGIIAPVVTGFLVQRTGTFGWAFAVSAAVPLVGMLGWGLILRRVEPLVWGRSVPSG
jgi:MFS family permease